MKPRQVFFDYAVRGSEDPAPYLYCPFCATKLHRRTDDRRYCESCGFVRYRNPSPGVVVLIENKSRIVLGRRSANVYKPNLWCLPGGYIEYGEDFLTAAHREVKEETGLDIEIESIISVISNFFDPSMHTLVVNLFAHPTGGSLAAGDDIAEVGWFAFDDEPPPLAYTSEGHIIARYAESRIVGAPVDPEFR